MADVLVRLRGVGRVYGSGPSAVVALREFDGEILRGDRIAVVGASGSGKSTLLHLIAGLDAPSSGTVDRPGLDPSRPLRPAQIAIVLQEPGLIAAMNVAENASLGVLLAGADQRRASTATHEALAQLGIGQLAERLPAELSEGQAQRVALARALAIGAPLVLADEPTGSLDRANADVVVDALLRAAGDGALVVATHDPLVAARFPKRWELYAQDAAR